MSNYKKKEPVFASSADMADILDRMTCCKDMLRISEGNLNEADGEIQDVLHELELDQSLKYHDVAALGQRLQKLRRQRRTAKDTIELMQPLANYLSKNPKLLSELQTVLGEMRKIENRHRNRFYSPRRRAQISNLTVGGPQSGLGNPPGSQPCSKKPEYRITPAKGAGDRKEQNP